MKTSVCHAGAMSGLDGRDVRFAFAVTASGTALCEINRRYRPASLMMRRFSEKKWSIWLKVRSSRPKLSAFLIVIRHVVDPRARGIATHRPGVKWLQQFESRSPIRHCGATRKLFATIAG